MATADYSSYYGTLADYFSNSSGTKSQGKSGGAGGSSQQYAAPTQQSNSSGGGGSDNTQGGNASTSGSSWISGAVSQTSSDKSQFTTPFSQQFGGITNNQVINSPGATGATTVSPIAPITGVPDSSGGGSSLGNPIILILAIFAGMALVLKAKG